MSETAEERKKRLRAMRDEAETVEPELKFRNYLPRDETLQEGQIKARQAPEFEAPVVEKEPDADDETAVLNVMPKKANFDLKRDVEKKMERLERKTQRAMIELMREEEERRVAEAQKGK